VAKNKTPRADFRVGEIMIKGGSGVGPHGEGSLPV